MRMEGIVLASNNRHKWREITRLLSLPPGALLAPDELLSELLSPEETGTTYEANAVIKGVAFARACGRLALADDSGLEVEALDGGPGIHSQRFAGMTATGAENCRKLLAALASVPTSDRRARFVCVIALCDADGLVLSARGECPGWITNEVRGSHGFGYDPIFIPEGASITFAEMTEEEKDRVSHRGQALRRFKAKWSAHAGRSPPRRRFP